LGGELRARRVAPLLEEHRLDRLARLFAHAHCPFSRPTPSRDPNWAAQLALGREIVWVLRKRLGAVFGDEDEVLEAATAEALAVAAGLDRDDIAGDELLARPAEPGRLVDFEADAVPERVVE